MLYYYQDTHYLPSGPPQTIITDEMMVKSPELRCLEKFAGPSIRIIQPHKKEYYSYYVYEKKNLFLSLLEIVCSENELNAEEIKVRIRLKSNSNTIREFSSTFDHRVLWETTQTEFRLWTFHHQSWRQVTHYVDGDKITIYYKPQLDERIEATDEYLKVFHRFSTKEYNPKKYKILYNWLSNWKYYTGLAIGDNYVLEKKLFSLWNVNHFSSDWFDLDDDIEWTRKVGVDLAKILNLEWEDRLKSVEVAQEISSTSKPTASDQDFGEKSE